jgi:Zn-dependent metalloprotease
MTYGQGEFLPLFTTLDIYAHEIGHGVFQSEVNYTSSTGEFGAINESWGACVE